MFNEMIACNMLCSHRSAHERNNILDEIFIVITQIIEQHHHILESCAKLFDETQKIGFAKYISSNICYLLRRVRCSIIIH